MTLALLSQLSLARPWWLLALLPLAVAAWAWRRPGRAAWRHAIDMHLQPHVLTEADAGHAGRATAMLAWLLAVLALAGPVLDDADAQPATRRDSLRVLVVDLSPEAAPQLERIKLKLHRLLRLRHDGETALLVYADEPYLVVPPTADANVAARFIPDLATDAMPAAGNRPERALRMAAALLERSGAGRRDILWVVGGDRHDALPEADLHGARVSVLHAGMRDLPALRQSAEETGGILLAMRSDDSDLNMLGDAMTGGRGIAAGRNAGGTELGHWLLLPLLPLAALRFRRGLLAVLPLFLCAGLFPPPAHAARPADLEARRLFEAGRHDEAAERFSDPRWKAAAHYRAGRFDEAARLLEGHEDPDSLYNRANALAKMGRLQEALSGYEAALRLRPDDADTLHNRDLVQRLLNRQHRGGGGTSGGRGAQGDSDASRVAGQWLRGVPDDPGSLLRRKLQAEHKRRLAGETERPW